MLKTGYPRNDYLINNNNINHIMKIKERLCIPFHKKVILYAPTWRDNQFYEKGRYKFDINLNFDKLQSALGDEYIILLRMHYLVKENFDLSLYKRFIYDFSNHDDIRELYIITDLLITDYSSVMFDYLCLNRPIVFYTFDIDIYRDKLRGFYFDFEADAPGPLVKTTEQLTDAIKQIEISSFKPSDPYKRFHEKFCSLEKGDSTEKVVNNVFLKRGTE